MDLSAQTGCEKNFGNKRGQIRILKKLNLKAATVGMFLCIAFHAASGLPLLAERGSVSGPLRPMSADERNQYSQRLKTAREAYFKVITESSESSDRQAHQALAALEAAYPQDPVAKAYHGSLELLDAAHSWSVWNLHKQAADGLSKLDEAVAEAPDEPEARFIRAATSWHLPVFYRRKKQCESDFALLAARAQGDASSGRLPRELAAATYNYWGQILVSRNETASAHRAFETAVTIAPASPGGIDAQRRLRTLK